VRLFLLLLSISFPFLSSGQNFLSWKFNDRYFTLQAGTGTASYFGELNYKNSINDRLNVQSIGVEARLLTKVGARLGIDFFNLSGSDANAPDSTIEKQRNLSFESKNFQVHLAGIYYFRPYKGDYYKRWSFDPYITLGVGYSYFQPKANLGGELIPLRPLETEGISYARWAFSIPAGIGAKFKINDFINLNFEASYHYAFTDYLDDVSMNYRQEFNTSTTELLSNRKNEIPLVNSEFYDQLIPGSKRGNPNNNDSFLIIRAKIEVYLPHTLFQ